MLANGSGLIIEREYAAWLGEDGKPCVYPYAAMLFKPLIATPISRHVPQGLDLRPRPPKRVRFMRDGSVRSTLSTGLPES